MKMQIKSPKSQNFMKDYKIKFVKWKLGKFSLKFTHLESIGPSIVLSIIIIHLGGQRVFEQLWHLNDLLFSSGSLSLFFFFFTLQVKGRVEVWLLVNIENKCMTFQFIQHFLNASIRHIHTHTQKLCFTDLNNCMYFLK